MVFLDVLVANLALPDIQEHFGGGESTMQWVVISYSIGMALFIMPAGALADRRGRRFVYVFAVVTFLVGSLLSGLAPAFWVLVAARFVQGAGGAAIMVCSLAIVSAEFVAPQSKARAIGIWTAVAAVGLGLGPTLGGLLTEGVSWRAVFVVGIPVGLVVLPLTFRFVDDSEDPVDRGFDLIGQGLFALAVTTLSVGVVAAPHQGWFSPVIVVCFTTTIAASVGFIWHELRAADPMVDLSLFSDSTYAWSIAAIFTVYFFAFGALLLVTQYWQNVRGLSPIQAGGLILPYALVMIIVPPRTGRFIARVGPLRPARIGLLTLAFGAGFLIVGLEFHWIAPFAFVVIAVGIAFCGPALASLSMSRVPPERSGMASGIFSVQRALGSTIGYALMGTIVTVWLGATLDDSLEPVIPNSSQRDAIAESIAGSANPHAHASEIGPARQLLVEGPTEKAEILDIAADNVVHGIQVSLTIGAFFVVLLWALGRYRYARPEW